MLSNTYINNIYYINNTYYKFDKNQFIKTNDEKNKYNINDITSIHFTYYKNMKIEQLTHIFFPSLAKICINIYITNDINYFLKMHNNIEELHINMFGSQLLNIINEMNLISLYMYNCYFDILVLQKYIPKIITHPKVNIFYKYDLSFSNILLPNRIYDIIYKYANE